MLSVKQGGVKYRFSSFWYDSTGDWTQVFQAIGEHSNHRADVQYQSQFGDRSRGWPEGSLFNSYYTEV